MRKQLIAALSHKMTPEEHAEVERCAQRVLDARAQFDKSLAWLYDPDTMPQVLLDAHAELDRAVDAAYGVRDGFKSESERVQFLFARYAQVTAQQQTQIEIGL